MGREERWARIGGKADERAKLPRQWQLDSVARIDAEAILDSALDYSRDCFGLHLHLRYGVETIYY